MRRQVIIAVVCMGASACALEKVGVSSESTTTTGMTSSSASVSETSIAPTTLSTTTTSSTSSTSEGSSTGSMTSETTGDCAFIGCHDLPPPSCSAFEQDCPEGYKCTIWASDGGSGWDDTRCVMVDPNPKPPGEVCVALDGLTGIDNCELGAYCWDVDPQTHEGTCISFCAGTSQDPICEAGYACISLQRGGADAGICFPGCHPLEYDCAADELCIPAWGGWQCAPDSSGDAGAYGDLCEFINACDPGLVCFGAEYLPGCEGSGCCTPLCQLGAPNTCPGENQVCIPWYDDGEAPEGYEDVGVCGIPN